MSDKGLSIYTNMPTPYQLDFFDALSELFSLNVVYFSLRESDRKWTLPVATKKYSTRVLCDNWLARMTQKKIPSFHFSNAIFSAGLREKNKNIILNGTYWVPNILLLLIFFRLRRKTVFFYGEALFPAGNKLQYLFKKVMLYPVNALTKGIFAVGTRAVESYRKYNYRKPIINVPYNIDISYFNASFVQEERLRELKKRYSPNGELVFLTSGALIKRKGTDIVIKAFQSIPNAALKLLILGDGAERGSLEELALPNDNIVFLGFQEKADVPYYFLLSDVFVFASWYDGWALVINEAIAADLAIISSSSVGAAADKLIDGKNALICEAGSIEGFASAMHLLATDQGLRHDLSTAGSLLKEEISSPYNAKKVYAVF